MLSPLGGFGSGLVSGNVYNRSGVVTSRATTLSASETGTTGSRGIKLSLKSNSSCPVREGTNVVCGRPGCAVGLLVWCRMSCPRVFSSMGRNVDFSSVASSEELDSFDSDDSELDAVNW